MRDDHKFDYEYLKKHGRVCQADAQAMHLEFGRQLGATPQEAIEIWNAMSPQAPWDCPEEQAKGPMYDKLTAVFRQFMSDMLKKDASLN